MHISSKSLARPCAPARRPNSLLNWFFGIEAIWRSRQSLAHLEPHLLEDIGVSAEAAAKEARQPLWNVPSHWIH